MGKGGQRHVCAATSLTTGRHFPDDDITLGDRLRLLDLIPSLLIVSRVHSRTLITWPFVQIKHKTKVCIIVCSISSRFITMIPIIIPPYERTTDVIIPLWIYFSQQSFYCITDNSVTIKKLLHSFVPNVWTAAEKLAPTGIRSPVRPARS